MTIGAPDAFAIILPVGVASPFLAVFVPLSSDSLNRKTPVCPDFVIVLFESILMFVVMGCTMDFGVEEHLRR